MRRIFTLLFTLMFLAVEGDAARIKDVARIQGARRNQLIGYGVVMGLAGSGDSNPNITLQSVANFMNRFGLTLGLNDIKANNAAIVVVTAELPAFVRTGTPIDVHVASFGDAKSLQGGVLNQTPLYGADGQVYAVAQGALSVGGFLAGTSGAGGSSLQKNHPTVGMVPNGALVEREVPSELIGQGDVLEISLNEPDFTTAARMADGLNRRLSVIAMAVDSGTVRVNIPPESMEPSKQVRFIAQVEAVDVDPDSVTHVVVNERTGTVVANAKVRISSVAVAHGNLLISIANNETVSQPLPFSTTGTTATTQATNTSVREEQSRLIVLPEMPTIDKVAAALNALGATPRDMIVIFQTLKRAGALQADLVIQ